MSDGLVLGNVLLDVRDALLQHRTVVYVNVAEEPVLVGMLQFLLHILVPSLHVVHHLVSHLLAYVLRYIVATLVTLDDDVEELLDARPCASYGRHYRHPDQFAQLLVVQLVATALQLVVHVQCHHHHHVHVDKLCGEVQVSFQVRAVYHVDDDVRHLLDDVLAHVNFFGRVSRERVRARQVHQAEAVSLEVEESLLGIHGYPAIVTHVLVGPRYQVEERCLPTIRVSYQGHVDGASLALGQLGQLLVGQLYGFGQ